MPRKVPTNIETNRVEQNTARLTQKDTRAAMLFGRAFERALAAYFLREDAAAVLLRE